MCLLPPESSSNRHRHLHRYYNFVGHTPPFIQQSSINTVSNVDLLRTDHAWENTIGDVPYIIIKCRMFEKIDKLFYYIRNTS